MKNDPSSVGRNIQAKTKNATITNFSPMQVIVNFVVSKGAFVGCILRERISTDS